MASKKTVLITGCSKGGLGDALAKEFHLRGTRVIATARNARKIEHFAQLGIETATLDVLSSDSIAQCVAQVSSRTSGRLDILVNNSGAGYSMPLVDASLDAARELFDLNVWSVLAVTQAFLPLLLNSEHGGMIVNNTSTAGCNYVPMLGIYNASKAAAITITGNLRLELEPFGMKVIDLRTGSVKSKFFKNQNDQEQMRTTLPENSIYVFAREEVEKVMSGDSVVAHAQDADRWAQDVVGDLLRKEPPTEVWRGGRAFTAWIGTFLPRAFLERIMREMGGIDELKKKMASQHNK